MAISVPATRQALADHFKTLGVTSTDTVYVSLHTADPDSTGADEATGGSYARQLGTWTSGSGGTLSMAKLTFSGMLAGTYTHAGLWKVSAGGTSADFVAGEALNPSITLGGTGPIDVTPSFTIS
ncbi:hypothetical protein [Nocardia sp. CC227C]|uniref:phage tail fiber protein n=1 Tax=Nocardia sp. CC227C TaxID=3044562 RepID=UPI00278C3D47|nr:hypothetical protein [Nocardia sp. CC227C]